MSKSLKNRNCIIGATIIFILMACGRSPVWHSPISPETKSIELWHINFIDKNPPSDSMPSLRILKEDLGVLGQTQHYINALKIDLMNEGIMITDTPVMGAGTINVTFHWHGVEGRITEQYTMPPISEWPPKNLPPHIIGAEVKLKKADNKKSVAVELLGPDGRMLGNASIRYGDIRAEFTARVIRKLIRTGKYE